jgi:hypothetical protein
MTPRTLALIVRKAEPILAEADAETQTAVSVLLETGGNMVSREAAEALFFAYLMEAGERQKLLRMVSRPPKRDASPRSAVVRLTKPLTSRRL